ncbi:ArsA family ATPase [Streptomyces abyssomicinicus]|uniref:ArsA family ATPase n=1 Tax=Streptomyces abyssomicinicus TaxID=574929 RepID=UPI0012501913|nr:ArsA-related P-loop ATPase [Streptomyces abyssomicinicus]
MRTVLITGPGGSGRTTVAAATALRAAREGSRTLLLTCDGTSPAGLPPGSVPGLAVRLSDPAEGFRDALGALQERAGSALDLLGARPLERDELTPLPGARELGLLRDLRRAARSGDHDVLVVDLPAAPDALALLALPGVLRRYLRRLLPPERQAARALRPLLGRLAGVPMPADWLYDSTARRDAELAEAQSLLDRASVRLTAEPGPAGAEAVRAAVLGLALHGHRPEALLANRVVPDSSPDAWLAALAAHQRGTLDEWAAALPVHTVPHLGRDPRGADDLAALGVPGVDAFPGAAGPAGPAAVERPVEDRSAEDGTLVWRIPLPGAVREELDLVRRGDELLLTVGRFHRALALPSVLRRCAVTGAALREGTLVVRFVPDPSLWPGPSAER